MPRTVIEIVIRGSIALRLAKKINQTLTNEENRISVQTAKDSFKDKLHGILQECNNRGTDTESDFNSNPADGVRWNCLQR